MIIAKQTCYTSSLLGVVVDNYISHSQWVGSLLHDREHTPCEIGRASCRDRVYVLV